MKLIIKISFTALLFVLLFTGNALSLDKYYLLAKSNIAKAEGRTEEAIQHLQDYIDAHPTTTGRHFKSYYNKKQYYIRNLLIAYSNLFDLFRENGKMEDVAIWNQCCPV